jgi:hypothetical protein
MKNMQSIDRQFVVVTDDAADAAGATTWWSLAGEAERDALLREMKARGIEHHPRLVEPETALGRAVGCLRGKRRIVRSIRKGKWAVIEEELDVSREKLRHWEGPTVFIDKVGRAVLENSTDEEAHQVREAYAHALDVLDTNDLSHWLLTAVERFGGIGLRRTGGIYYVPPQRMKEWRQFIEVLAIVAPKCTVYTVPTVRLTADGARAILDSLTTEVEDAAEKLSQEVIGGDLGIRGLDNRAESSRQLLSKVSQYEELLGTRIEKLRTLIEKLDVDVAAARLAAEALADEAAAS